LYQNNTLTSVGRALAIWGQNLKDEMLFTTSTPMVKCFATRTPGEIMNVFLVNRDTMEHSIQLELLNKPGMESRAGKWMFTGTSLKDKDPEWKESGDVKIKRGKIKDVLDPYSITMYSVKLNGGGR
jgi:hypothetical protein